MNISRRHNCILFTHKRTRTVRHVVTATNTEFCFTSVSLQIILEMIVLPLSFVLPEVFLFNETLTHCTWFILSAVMSNIAPWTDHYRREMTKSARVSSYDSYKIDTEDFCWKLTDRNGAKSFFVIPFLSKNINPDDYTWRINAFLSKRAVRLSDMWRALILIDFRIL